MARFRLLFSFVLAAPAGAALLLWAVGRALTDSLAATQYVFWIPSVFLVPPATVLALGAAWLARGGRRQRGRWSTRARRGRRWRRATSVLGAASLVCLAWMLLVNWHIHRAVLPGATPDAARSMSIFHWNMAAQHVPVWEENLKRLPRDPWPDLILLTNAHWGSRFADLGELTGFDSARWRHLGIACRFPIVRSAGASLGLPRPEAYPSNGGSGEGEEGEPERDPRTSGWYDPGQLFVAEIDASEVLGRTVVVWLIDLPSDPSIARRDVAALVQERLAALDGEWRGGGPAGFDGLPEPDLIAGDFNMPRGSAALSRLTRGLTHAHAQAGWGPSATYRTPRPFWHIDHLFVRSPLRAARYEVRDLGRSTHRAQMAVVTVK